MRYPLVHLLYMGLCAMLMAAAAEAGTIPANEAATEPGMEVGSWIRESWGNTGSAERQRQRKRQVLKISFDGGEQPKASFKHLTGFSADAAGKVTVHVYAPDEQAPEFAIALSTTQAYVWHESKTRKLKQGWNKLEFPLAKGEWKTEASKWQYDAGIDHLNDIRAVNLIALNGKTSGWLLVEGLHYDGDETAKRVAALIAEMGGTDFEKQAAAEQELIKIGRPAMEALYQLSRSDRTAVMLRASFALRTIEEAQEELPENPELREKLMAQREENKFQEMSVRSSYILRSMKNEQEKLAQLVKDGAEEVARARLEVGSLKSTKPEDLEAYKKNLDELDRLTKLITAVLEQSLTMPEPTPAEPAKIEAPKPDAPKPDAPAKTASEPMMESKTMEGKTMEAMEMKPKE